MGACPALGWAELGDAQIKTIADDPARNRRWRSSMPRRRSSHDAPRAFAGRERAGCSPPAPSGRISTSPRVPPEAGLHAREARSDRDRSPIAGGTAQRFVDGKDIPGQWWTLFHSEPLDQLIAESLKANPTLEAAQATLRQAQENVAAQQGVFFPQVNGSLSSTRQKISGASFGNPRSNSIFTLTTGSVSVSYALDIFGGERRQLESTEAQAGVSALRARSLLSDDHLERRRARRSRRRRCARRSRRRKRSSPTEQQQLNVLREAIRARRPPRARPCWRSRRRSTPPQATLPGLQKQLAQQRNQLTALAGRFPSQEVSQTFDLASLQSARGFAAQPALEPGRSSAPISRRREAQLHAASAQVGVATAAMLPQITLNASYGNTVLDAASLFSGPGIWSLGAGLTHAALPWRPALASEARGRSGASTPRRRNIAPRCSAAFQNVADALRALQSDADALKARSRGRAFRRRQPRHHARPVPPRRDQLHDAAQCRDAHISRRMSIA